MNKRVRHFRSGRCRRNCDDARCASLRDEQKQAMLAEYRRLLYVALTRAEDRLYICGATGKKTVSDECWYSLIQNGIAPIAAKFDIPGEGCDGGLAKRRLMDDR